MDRHLRYGKKLRSMTASGQVAFETREGYACAVERQAKLALSSRETDKRAGINCKACCYRAALNNADFRSEARLRNLLKFFIHLTGRGVGAAGSEPATWST